MIKSVFSVLDSKAGVYQAPFLELSVGSAVRAFTLQVNQPCYMNAFPEDFILYQIGTFDDTTTEYVPLNPIKSLGTAVQYVRDDLTKAFAEVRKEAV